MLGGELGSAFVRIRPQLGTFAAEARTAIKGSLKEVQAAVAQTAAANTSETMKEVRSNAELASSYAAVGAAAESSGGKQASSTVAAEEAQARLKAEVASVARANVAETLKEVKANEALSASYLAVGKAAASGSAEQRAANTLAASSQLKSKALLGETAVAAAASGSAFGGAKGKMVGMTAGLVGVTAGLVAAKLAFNDVVVGGANFERQLDVFQYTSQASGKEMKEAAAQAKALGNDVRLPGVSAADAAEALTELAKGGISVRDSIDGVRGAVQLATAGMLDGATAAGIIAQAMSAFELTGKRATDVADLLAGAAQSAQGEVGDMALGLQQSASVAHTLNIPIEDTITALAMIAKNGIVGAEGGTTFRSMLLALVPTTRHAREQVEALGIQLKDQHGDLLPLPNILKQYGDQLGKLRGVDRQVALKNIFGTYGFQAAAILSRTADQFGKLRESVNRNNASLEASAARTKGLAGSWGALKSNLETAGISISAKVNPSIKRLIDNLNEGITWITANWPKIEATIGPVLDNIREAMTSFGDFATAFWDRFGSVIKAVFGRAFRGELQLVKNVLGAISGVFELFAGILQGDWRKAWAGLKGIASNALHAVVDLTKTFLGIYKEVGAHLGGAIVSGFKGALHGLEGLAAKAGLKIVEPFTHLPGWLGGGGFQKIKKEFQGLLDDVKPKSELVGDRWGVDRAVKDHAAAAAAKAAAKEIPEAVEGVVGKARAAGKKVVEAVADGVKDDVTLQHALRSLRERFAEAVKTTRETVRGSVLDAQKNLVSLGQGLGAQLASIIDAGPLGQMLKRLQDQLAHRQFRAQARSLRDDIVAAQKELAKAQSQIVTVGPVSKASQDRIDAFLNPKKKALRDARAANRDFADEAVIGGIQANIDKQKAAATRAVDDLTAAFVSGAGGSAQTFAAKLSQILGTKVEGFEKAGKLLGFAFGTSFTNQVDALTGQAGAIQKGRGVAPGLAGQGLRPEIVRPVTVMNQQLAVQHGILKEMKQARKDAADRARRAKVKADAAAKKKADKKADSPIVQLPGAQSKTAAVLNGTTG